MRKLIVLVALFAPSLSQAKRAQKAHTDPRLTFVEDEPMAVAATTNPRSTADVGTRMDGTIRAPEVARVSSGEATSRGASAAPAPRTDEVASGDAIQELVARQMRRNQASIDACVKEAARRKPHADGTISLAVVVNDKKVKSVHVADDTVHDIDLDSCLVKAGFAWKLQLASASFNWPVTLSPAASP